MHDVHLNQQVICNLEGYCPRDPRVADEAALRGALSTRVLPPWPLRSAQRSATHSMPQSLGLPCSIGEHYIIGRSSARLPDQSLIAGSVINISIASIATQSSTQQHDNLTFITPEPASSLFRTHATPHTACDIQRTHPTFAFFVLLRPQAAAATAATAAATAEATPDCQLNCVAQANLPICHLPSDNSEGAGEIETASFLGATRTFPPILRRICFISNNKLFPAQVACFQVLFGYNNDFCMIH